MAGTTILTTRRLRLRQWRMSDVDAYYTHCNTDTVMEHLGGVTSKRAIRQEIRWYRWHQERHGHTFWVIERKRDQAFIGFCGIIRVPERDSPCYGDIEIGWRVRADAWRRGYGFEAAQGVLRHAFAQFEPERIIARIAPNNVASWRLARKLGMRRRRNLDHHDPLDGTPYRVYEIARGRGR